MELIADILLVSGALGAGLYCLVLGRRLNRFNDLEKGVGGAVAVLSAQVDDLTRTLSAAKDTAGSSATTLTGLTKRAEGIARKLELQMAALHDISPPEAQNDASEVVYESIGVNPKAGPKASELMFTRHRKSQDAA